MCERHSAIVGDLTEVPSLSFSLDYSGMCFEIGSSKESFLSSTRIATKVAVIGLVMEAIETDRGVVLPRLKPSRGCIAS